MPADEQVARKFLHLLKNAKKRDLEFNLSLTSVRNLLAAKVCYFTGVQLTEPTFDAVARGTDRTIDRVDAAKGYVKGNVVACCLSFNQKKSSLTIEDIEILYHKTRKFK